MWSPQPGVVIDLKRALASRKRHGVKPKHGLNKRDWKLTPSRQKEDWWGICWRMGMTFLIGCIQDLQLEVAKHQQLHSARLETP